MLDALSKSIVKLSGSGSSAAIYSSQVITTTITFEEPFNSVPTVTASGYAMGYGGNETWLSRREASVSVSSITEYSFVLSITNPFGGNSTLYWEWSAYAPTLANPA